MLYRALGNKGPQVSSLGFGCMRLPIASGDSTMGILDPDHVVDEAESIRMIQYAFDQGINYFDTAYFYHGGISETILGKALKPHREKVIIATKLPAGMVESPSDFERFLTEQLERLDTDYIDMYLLHGLNQTTWNKLKDYGILKFLDKILADGRAKYVGFSFHDGPDTFKEIVDSYDWTLCQIQYNYCDEDYQAGRQGLEYAAAKGMGIVIMEPLRGGSLAGEVPEEVQTLWDQAESKRSAAEWALRWVWDHPEVSTVLSGMSNMEQLVENIKIAENALPNSLAKEERDLLEQTKNIYKSKLKVNCTSCAYCMPCPSNVSIPSCFAIYNRAGMFGQVELSKMLYSRFVPAEANADNCIECGECEEKCPQQIQIMEELKNAHEFLT